MKKQAKNKTQSHTEIEALSRVGAHRVIEPPYALPQAAMRVNSDPRVLNSSELLIDVDCLMLDATSMRQIRESCGAAGHDFDSTVDEKMKARILEIVNERGKMHNPVTNSGGVLVGRVKELGARFIGENRSLRDQPLLVGQALIPVASLSTLPLKLTRVKSILGDRVEVEGVAVMFSCMAVCTMPEGFSESLTLACVDISSLIPQLSRCFHELLVKLQSAAKDRLGSRSEAPVCIRVLVIGCGKAGLAALALLGELKREVEVKQRESGVSVQVLAVDYSQVSVDLVKERQLADSSEALDARDARALFDFVSRETQGQLCDLIVNLVNVKDTETATVLCARSRVANDSKPLAKILWFSMATQFDKAALATDSLGKDVEMLIGNGVAENQVEETVALVKRNSWLKEFF